MSLSKIIHTRLGQLSPQESLVMHPKAWRSKIIAGVFGGRIAKGATGTFSMKVINAGLVFISSVLLARFLGTGGYGTYTFVMAWIGLLTIPALLGLENLIVREMAVYQTRTAWGMIRGLLRKANQIVSLSSLSLALIATAVAFTLIKDTAHQLPYAFGLGMIILPLNSLTCVRQATMRGLHKFIIGQLPELLIRPLLFIALVSGIYLFMKDNLTVLWVIGMQTSAVGVAFLVGTWYLLRIMPPETRDAAPVYQTSQWLKSALPLLLIGGMTVINARTDVVMLGILKGADEVGIYHVAYRGAELITFALTAVNVVLGPTVATLYSKSDMVQLQRIITRSARMVMLIAFPIAFSLIFFGHWFLLIFGDNFTQGKIAMAILSIGQFTIAGMGSVGVVLVMTGHERDAAWGIGFGAFFNIILNFLLIPKWGIEGAAAATATSMIIWNLLLVSRVYRRTSIHTTALGIITAHK